VPYKIKSVHLLVIKVIIPVYVLDLSAEIQNIAKHHEQVKSNVIENKLHSFRQNIKKYFVSVVFNSSAFL
jgi:hypothetical protein